MEEKTTNPRFWSTEIRIVIDSSQLEAFRQTGEAIAAAIGSFPFLADKAFARTIAGSFYAPPESVAGTAQKLEEDAKQRVFSAPYWPPFFEPIVAAEVATSARRRLAEVAEDVEPRVEKEPASAQEFLAQKLARAQVTQQAQRRERVKPWEDKGKRFR